MTHNGGHIQNTTIAGAHHSRDKRAADQECRDQTRIQYTAKLVEGKIDQRLTDIRARVVDQNLGMTEALGYSLLHGGNIVLSRHIPGKYFGCPATLDDSLAHRLQTLHIASHEGNLGAGVR